MYGGSIMPAASAGRDVDRVRKSLDGGGAAFAGRKMREEEMNGAGIRRLPLVGFLRRPVHRETPWPRVPLRSAWRCRARPRARASMTRGTTFAEASGEKCECGWRAQPCGPGRDISSSPVAETCRDGSSADLSGGFDQRRAAICRGAAHEAGIDSTSTTSAPIFKRTHYIGASARRPAM